MLHKQWRARLPTRWLFDAADQLAYVLVQTLFLVSLITARQGSAASQSEVFLS